SRWWCKNPKPAVCRRYIGERFTEGVVVYVHSVAEGIVGESVEGSPGQHAGNCAESDIDHVIGRPAAVRETRAVASQQSETAAGGFRCRIDARVQPQQIG